MTIKKLTAEGRFECGIDEFVQGKVWAFIARTDEAGVGLGIAVANEPGYYPLPMTWAHGDFTDLEAMWNHADELNAAEGMTPRTAAEIVCSTMRKNPPRGS